ncbi:site-specific integrase [Paraburkholderia sp. HP33-1]|uniref:site-specific integrase n=1 Tax=Paraburkholderia sp. HP33-1 TaxID=2883243 RepID=UPI001F2CF337|nr:site-specific integrase [Paraburkholderia sp. HP33-1]
MRRKKNSSNREDRELLVKLEARFDYFSHLGIDKDPVFKPAINLSCLNWPDGRLCFVATAFLQEQFEKNCATEIRGGTLRTKGYHLTHLIRFCYQSKTDFIDLTDAQFTLFANNMLTGANIPGNPLSGLLRNGSVPYEICRDSLDFLEYVGKFSGKPELVSKHGQIRAERVTQSHIDETTGVIVTRISWARDGLPRRGEVRTRQAISDENLKKLTSSVKLVVKQGNFTIYRKRRMHVILRLLRILGCRRTELVLLKVSDFEQAEKMASPKLTVTTLKHKKPETRRIDINHVEIREVLNFVKYFRSTVIGATCGDRSDDGFLLISATTGKRLAENTITQLIRELKVAAEISEQTCAHMFRNLFIVERLCYLMEKHKMLNKDEFKRALIDKHTLLKDVMKETGQKNMRTILRYLEGAEAKLANLALTKKSVRADLLEDSLRVCQEQHLSRMSEGVSELVSLRIFQDSVAAARKEASALSSS